MKLLYQQREFPTLQNRVYDTAEEAINCLKGDITLVQDSKTGLIYNSSFSPELVVYDSNYNNEQGISTYFRKHLIEIATMIENSMGQKSLVEVGCGKGLFLEMLFERGCEIVGFDPTYEGSNPNIVKKFFEPGLINTAKGLILRHVLEHISNPVDFLFQLKDANGGGGLIYIEVPCFDWICEKKTWFDIFYEHVNYFRLRDFQRMFSAPILYSRTFGGQYLSIIADLTYLRYPIFEPFDEMQFPSNFLNSLNFTEQNRTEQNSQYASGAQPQKVSYSRY